MTRRPVPRWPDLETMVENAKKGIIDDTEFALMAADLAPRPARRARQRDGDTADRRQRPKRPARDRRATA